MIQQIADEIISGRRLNRDDDLSFLRSGDLEERKKGANKIREALCGNHVNLCSIINGRAGRCSENCKFCAQSAHNHTGAKEYDLLDADEVIEACKRNEAYCVHKFSIVTA